MPRLNFPSIEVIPKFKSFKDIEDYLENLINQIYTQFELVAEEVNYGTEGTVADHSSSHEDGGSDEVSIADLSGMPADLASHHARHETGGADEISISSLAGEWKFQLLATDPTGLVATDEGRVWFNTTEKKWKGWNGTEIVLLG